MKSSSSGLFLFFIVAVFIITTLTGSVAIIIEYEWWALLLIPALIYTSRSIVIHSAGFISACVYGAISIPAVVSVWDWHFFIALLFFSLPSLLISFYLYITETNN